MTEAEKMAAIEQMGVAEWEAKVARETAMHNPLDQLFRFRPDRM